MLAGNRKLALPGFGKLALVGFSTTAPFIALALILGYLKVGISLFGGFVLALVIYGLLYLVVGRGLNAVDLGELSSKDAGGKASGGMANMAMVAVMMGKYLVVAILLYFAWHTGYLLVAPFLIGFVLAQIGITWTSVAQTKRAPLAGPPA